MDKIIINGVDFLNMELMRYWSFPSSYDTKRRQNELNNMLYSGDYLASEKKDGYAQLIIKDEFGIVKMRSRSKGVNGWVCKEEWVPHLNPFFQALPNGTCLLCEIYLPNKTSKDVVSVLGCLKEKAVERQSKDENKLNLHIFDVLAYDNKNLMKLSIEKRVAYLNKINLLGAFPFTKTAVYWLDANEIHENWLRVLAEGGEGVVLTKKDYLYEPKKRAARKTLKLKKELQETIDVFLTGAWKSPTYAYTGKDKNNWPYWYNLSKEERYYGKLSDRVEVADAFDAVTRLWFQGWAGSVQIAVMKDGAVTPIGWISGVEDEVRKGIVENTDAYIGKVLELQAMEIDRSDIVPTLRHGRIVRWRDDKVQDDCQWEQLI